EVLNLYIFLIFPFILFLVISISFMQPASLVYMLLIGYGFIAQSFPSIVGMFMWPRANKHGAFWGIIAGFIVTVIFLFIIEHPFGIHAGIWGLGINSIVFNIVSISTQPVSKTTIERFFPDMVEELYEVEK